VEAEDHRARYGCNNCVAMKHEMHWSMENRARHQQKNVHDVMFMSRLRIIKDTALVARHHSTEPQHLPQCPVWSHWTACCRVRCADWQTTVRSTGMLSLCMPTKLGRRAGGSRSSGRATGRTMARVPLAAQHRIRESSSSRCVGRRGNWGGGVCATGGGVL
jgi:hypothetical protein